MALSERLFEPPAADADKVEARLRGVSPQLSQLIQRAGDALAADDLPAAQRALALALALAPAQPDVLRLYGLLLSHTGNHDAAQANFAAALRAAPDDAVTFWQYARAREDAGKLDAAFELRRQAIARLPQSPLAWVDLGEHLYTYATPQAAIVPLERAVQLAPSFVPAVLKLGSAQLACGRVEEGARLMRQALRLEPAFAAAWVALVDIKTVPLEAAELDQMRALLAPASPLLPGERTALEFALAAACERSGAYAEAWQRLQDANARRKRELRPWDVERFRLQEAQADVVFAQSDAHAIDTQLGREVIFVVGLPRSGTTLVEQILASHPDVEGAGELAALPAVLTEESTHRQQRYPAWVPDASAGDWQRLGERYLALTRGVRGQHPFATDKLPTNWRALGAIRAMLPGSHIVVCRRDPLENCWSCFKQYFPDGWEFTSDIEHLGLFWRAFDHAATEWARRAPARVREQGYERLTAHAEAEIRALLGFCGLPFDAACLRPHELRRSVRTLSAAQVHEPIYAHRSTAAAYGALIDPLRAALGLPLLAGSRP
ncbi:MAG TPA: sulfotransferase [Rhodanobacteraceae bacterium]|nr:sulfotransferase [Rhodanobacteraceae bacterium]